jgi:hypothetical protein
MGERVREREGWVCVRGVDVYVHFAHNRNSGCNCRPSHSRSFHPNVSQQSLHRPLLSCRGNLSHTPMPLVDL